MKKINNKAQCCCHSFDNNYDFRHSQRQTVTFSDKKSSSIYRYNNKCLDHLAKFQIDGGLIVSGMRCDYLLINCEKKHSIFIELKGSDLSHAIDQIERSIDILKTNLSGFAFFGRIVVSRMNTIALKSTRMLKLESKLRKLNGDLLCKCNLLEEHNN